MRYPERAVSDTKGIGLAFEGN